MPARSRFARQVPNAPTGRKLSNLIVRDMRGLNSTDPYGILQPHASPYLRNVRMYKTDTERQVSISTREGAAFYSVPIGEAQVGYIDPLIMIDKLDSITGWTSSHTLSLETTNKVEGTGSAKIVMSTAGTFSNLDRLNATAIDLSSTTGVVFVSVFIPTPTSGSVSTVRFYTGSDATMANNFSYWAVTTQANGNAIATNAWNTFKFDLGTTATGTTGTPVRTAIKSITIQVGSASNFQLNGWLVDNLYIQNTVNTTDYNFSYITNAAQKFTVTTTGALTKMQLRIKKDSGTKPITVKIFSDSANNPNLQLAISTIDTAQLTGSYDFYTVYFVDAPTLTAGTNYWYTVAIQESGTDNHYLSTTSSSSLAKTSIDGGKTWVAAAYSFHYRVFTSTVGPIKGFTRFYPPTGSPVTFFAHGNNIYSVNDITGATTSQKSGLNAAATKVRFTQLNNAVYAANGYDPLQRSTGTTFAAVTLPVSITPTIITTHKAKLFAVDATDKNLIRWSEENDYTNWLSTNAEYVPESNYASPITAMVSFQDNLVIFTEDNKYVMYGDISDDFVFRQAIGNRGAVSQEAVVNDENYVYFVADDGQVYRWNGSRDEQLSRVIQSDLDDVADFSKVKLSIWNNRLYYWFQSNGSTNYDSCFVFETRYGEWFYDTGRFIDNALALVQEDDSAIFASDHVGALYKSTTKVSDLGKPIDFKYHTNYFDFGAPNNYKQVRRLYLQFRTANWNGTINVSSDTDFLNDPTTEQFSITTKGFNWGSFVWGNPNYVWGQNNQFIRHRMSVPGQATNFQVRVEKYGADTPVYFMGFSQYYRLRRPA